MIEQNMKNQTREAIETLLEHELDQSLYNNCVDTIAGELLNTQDYIERCKLFREVGQALECNSVLCKGVKKELSFRYEAFDKEHELVEYPVLYERVEDYRPFESKSCFPSDIAEYFDRVVENIQVYPEMAALSCLSVLASAVQGKARISANGDYAEELCLYTMTVGDVSERKSSTFETFMEPAKQYITEKNKELEPIIRRENAEIKSLKVDLKSYENHRTGSGTPDTYKANNIKLEELEAKRTTLLSLPTTNATPEAFVEEMATNNGKATVLSSESGIFDVIGGIYSKSGKTDLDPLLNAWSGSPMSVSRAGGRKMQIEHPTATIGLMSQPEKFDEIIKTKGFSDRGLTARFLYAFAKPKAGQTTFRSPKIPAEAKKKYAAIIKNMMNIPVPESKQDTPVINFSHKAQIIAERYYDKIEKARKDGLFSEGTFAKGYGGKVFGNYVRIAGILHLCGHGTGEEIDEGTAFMAQRFSEWTINQVKKIIEETATESEEERRLKALTKKLMKKYKAGEIFTKRDITGNLKGRGAYTGENGYKLLNEDIEELTERFFVLDKTPDSEGKRKAQRFTLNPFIYDLL